MNYRQCLLLKFEPADSMSFLATVAWIPEKFAHRMKMLKLKDDYGYWSDGWTVQEIYSKSVPEFFVLKHERDFAKQREASDI